MNKKVFVILSCLVCTLTSFSQNTLNIHQKTGGVVCYGLGEKPVVTYKGDCLHVHTAKVDIDFPIDNLLRFTFDDAEIVTTVDEVHTLRTSDNVNIYTMNGVLMKTFTAAEGTTTFCTSDLPVGAYIIKNGQTTYKIIKR